MSNSRRVNSTALPGNADGARAVVDDDVAVEAHFGFRLASLLSIEVRTDAGTQYR